MAYTVKQLSQLSGVSVRTLHWYDHLGILKPAYYADNGYRYYENPQLLQLQQILFFRALGVSLAKIEGLLQAKEFDQIVTLTEHQKVLQDRIQHANLLLQTIESTLIHLQGDLKMQPEHLYEGLKTFVMDSGPEVCFMGQCTSYKDPIVIIHNSQKADASEWTKEQCTDFVVQANEIYREIAACWEKNLDPKSDSTQKVIQKHSVVVGTLQHLSREVYLAYAALYESSAGCQAQLLAVHPELPAYMIRAMRIYAYNDLE